MLMIKNKVFTLVLKMLPKISLYVWKSKQVQTDHIKLQAFDAIEWKTVQENATEFPANTIMKNYDKLLYKLNTFKLKYIHI